MRTKQVYTYDANGYLTGITDAFESPLEPGVYHIPAQSTDVLPPETIPADMIVRWDGTQWQVEPIVVPQAEIEPEPSVDKAEVARGRRNALLAETDYLFLTDSPSNPKKADFEAYRAALRDITIQAGFPENIIWPEKP